MPTVAELLRAAEERLSENDIPDARREAASLLCLALIRDRAFLIAHPEYEITESENELFQSVVHRRAEREPFHYITGVKEFYGLEFAVSPAVLIPRPETEMLVERAIGLLIGSKQRSFCEVGVGSGCISIATLSNVLNASAVGLDVSREALGVARRNAAANNVANRLDLRESDVFASLAEDERFDLIVSNPPYVPAPDLNGLQREVRDYEPWVALTDGNDGLSIIRSIVARSPQFLKPGGVLMFEFGMGQAEDVQAMFSPEIWQSAQVENDLQGIPRMIMADLRI